MKLSWKSKTIFATLLVAFNIWILITQSHPWIVSSLTILFHEAGHILFSFFGHTLMVLGGTIVELLIPSLCICYFYMRYDTLGELFSWWWFSIALYSVSIYVGDARSQSLSLIGGPGGHDWSYLLGQFGLLHYDQLISRILMLCMMIVTIKMVLLLRTYVREQRGTIIS